MDPRIEQKLPEKLEGVRFAKGSELERKLHGLYGFVFIRFRGWFTTSFLPFARFLNIEVVPREHHLQTPNNAK